jgi:hypothetical protein
MGPAWYQRSLKGAPGLSYWYAPAVMGRLSIVAGLVVGIVVAALLLGGIVFLGPDGLTGPDPTPLAAATPGPSSSPSGSPSPLPSVDGPASPAISPGASAGASVDGVMATRVGAIMPGVAVTP